MCLWVCRCVRHLEGGLTLGSGILTVLPPQRPLETIPGRPWPPGPSVTWQEGKPHSYMEIHFAQHGLGSWDTAPPSGGEAVLAGAWLLGLVRSAFESAKSHKNYELVWFSR